MVCDGVFAIADLSNGMNIARGNSEFLQVCDYIGLASRQSGHMISLLSDGCGYARPILRCLVANRSQRVWKIPELDFLAYDRDSFATTTCKKLISQLGHDLLPTTCDCIWIDVDCDSNFQSFRKDRNCTFMAWIPKPLRHISSQLLHRSPHSLLAHQDCRYEASQYSLSSNRVACAPQACPRCAVARAEWPPSAFLLRLLPLAFRSTHLSISIARSLQDSFFRSRPREYEIEFQDKDQVNPARRRKDQCFVATVVALPGNAELTRSAPESPPRFQSLQHSLSRW